MQKIYDAIGLPPMLCVFAIVALFVGALGIVRLVVTEHGTSAGNGPITALK
jgi:hypothetical protein